MSALKELSRQAKRLPAEIDAVLSILELLKVDDAKEALAEIKRIVRDRERLEKTVTDLRGKAAAANVDIPALARDLAGAAESPRATEAATSLKNLKLKKSQLAELGKQLQLGLSGTAKEMLETISGWLKTGEKPPSAEEVVANFAQRARPLLDNLLADDNSIQLRELVAQADRQLDAKAFKDFARQLGRPVKGSKAQTRDQIVSFLDRQESLAAQAGVR